MRIFFFIYKILYCARDLRIICILVVKKMSRDINIAEVDPSLLGVFSIAHDPNTSLI